MEVANYRGRRAQGGQSPRMQYGRQPSASRASTSVHPYNPMGDVRVECLRLARKWRDEGAVYQALYAYAGLLARFRRTPTADAAAEELLEMVQILERQGMRHTALDLFDKIEQAL